MVDRQPNSQSQLISRDPTNPWECQTQSSAKHREIVSQNYSLQAQKSLLIYKQRFVSFFFPHIHRYPKTILAITCDLTISRPGFLISNLYICPSPSYLKLCIIISETLCPPLWFRCNIVASHSACPGSIPSRVSFPGWGFFQSFSPTVRQMSGKLGPIYSWISLVIIKLCDLTEGFFICYTKICH